MKRTTKWVTLFLALVMVINSMVVSGSSSPVFPSMEEMATDTVELGGGNEPAIGEEIVEWREEGVRHYYVGDGVYQAVVSTSEVTSDGSISPAANTPNSSSLGDTYISSVAPNEKYGASNQLWVSNTQTSFIYCNRPTLPPNANISDAKLYFSYKYNISTGSLSLGVYPVYVSWAESSWTWNQANSYENLGIETNCVGTANLPGTTATTKISVQVTNEVKLWYMNNLKYNYGFALKRRSGTNNSVILMSKEAGSATSPYLVVSYTLDSLPVTNGVYYIRNNQYVTLFAHTLNNDGMYYCKTSPYDSSTKQQWRIEYLHNGYYVIKNVSENRVLSVGSGKENTTGYLIRETFSGATRQQWKITQNSDGSYKIKPRSSESYTADWVMCATESNSSGEILQNTYNGSDGNLSDEWIIQSVNAEPSISLPTKILINQSLQGQENSIIADYLQAVAAFKIIFGIEFQTPTIEYAPELNVNSQCATYSNKSQCCSSACGDNASCEIEHHKSAFRLKQLRNSNSVYTCRIVDYAICGRLNGAHNFVGGISTIGGKNSTVTQKQASIRSAIQHELTHNLGVSSEGGGCSSQYCIMQTSNTSFNYWCDNCIASIIRNNLN